MAVYYRSQLGRGSESGQHFVVYEERRRAVDTQCRAGVDVLLDAGGLLVAAGAGVEGGAVEADVGGVSLEVVGGQVVLIVEQLPLVFSEAALIVGALAGAGGVFGVGVDAPQRKVPEHVTDQAGVNVVLLDGRKLRPRKRAAERSLEVGVFDDRHRGVGVAEDVVGREDHRGRADGPRAGVEKRALAIHSGADDEQGKNARGGETGISHRYSSPLGNAHLTFAMSRGRAGSQA